METCKVIFINESGQKIILDFNASDNGDLDYKPSFEPHINNPKVNLGLAGNLCEIFIQALLKDDNIKDTQVKNDRTKRSTES